jgi:uncharacterized protein
MTVKTLAVLCPTCRKEVLMIAANAERPFCSKRCKLIDLGEWASEGHKIPGGEITEEDLKDLEE